MERARKVFTNSFECRGIIQMSNFIVGPWRRNFSIWISCRSFFALYDAVRRRAPLDLPFTMMKSHARSTINSSFSIGELRLLRKRHKVEYYKHNLAYSVNCYGAKLHTKQITFDYCELLESLLLLNVYIVNSSVVRWNYVWISSCHGNITSFVCTKHTLSAPVSLVKFIGGMLCLSRRFISINSIRHVPLSRQRVYRLPLLGLLKTSDSRKTTAVAG